MTAKEMYNLICRSYSDKSARAELEKQTAQSIKTFADIWALQKKWYEFLTPNEREEDYQKALRDIE